jgi:hypothetical protein
MSQPVFHYYKKKILDPEQFVKNRNICLVVTEPSEPKIKTLAASLSGCLAVSPDGILVSAVANIQILTTNI